MKRHIFAPLFGIMIMMMACSNNDKNNSIENTLSTMSTEEPKTDFKT